MEGIKKLRAMQRWFDNQDEYITDGISLKNLEKIYDYSLEHDLAYMDNDYLFSEYIDKNKRTAAIKFLKSLK